MSKAIKTKVKAPSLTVNHNATAMKIKTKVKAPALTSNHNAAAIRIQK